jgi:uncharacterized RDD family membrane protein YckC
MRCNRCGFENPAWVERCEFCRGELAAGEEAPEFELPLESRPPPGRLAPGREPRLFGGFFRRAFAFALDLSVLGWLEALLFYLTYVAYKVGLAAHGRAVDLGAVAQISFSAGVALAVAYFAVLQGAAGQTVGKWMMGLRVVSEGDSPIGYRRALVRCAGYLLSAFFLLGFLWILFHRERRAWHDLLAGTWVIRERA